MTEQTKQQFVDHVAQIASIMRGAGLTSLDCVEQIGYLLYLKLLDDVYPVTTYRDGGSDYWRIAHWLQVNPADLPRHIGQEVYPRLALKSIGQPEVDFSVRAIFNGAYLLVRDPKALQDILHILQKIELDWQALQVTPASSFSPSLGIVFENLLAQLSTENVQFNRFYTPRYLVDLMVQMVDPRDVLDIYDPAFGTGGMFIGIARYLQQHRPMMYGREIDFRMYKLGLMNIVFNGLNPQGLRFGDSLSREAEHDPQTTYSAILTNLLFESGTIPVTDRAAFPIQTRDFAALFLQHIVERLDRHGRAAVVVPEGLLFHTGSEQKVRQYFLEKVQLEAVLSLPQRVFAPYTSGKASILFFRKPGPTQTTVVFYDISSLDLQKIATQNGSNPPSTAVQAQIWVNVQVMARRQEVPIKKIRNENDILTANHYLAQTEISAYPLVQLGDLLRPSVAKAALQPDPEQWYRRLRVSSEQHGVTVRETVRGTTLQSNTSEFYTVRYGQIIVDPRHADEGASGVVPPDMDAGIVPDSYSIYDIPSPNVSPEFLDYCLRYKSVLDQLKQQGTGKRIDHNVLLRIRVPLPPKDIQDDYISRLNTQQQLLRQAEQMRKALETGEITIEPALFSQGEQQFLGELGDVQRGAPTKSQTGIEGLPVIRVQNLEKGQINDNDLKYISLTQLSQSQLSQYSLRPGDLLFIRVHGSREKVGLCAVFNFEKQYLFSENIIRVRLNFEQVHPPYVAMYMNSLVGRRTIAARIKGSLQLSINTEDIRSLPIPLPSLAEQQRIVEQLHEQQKRYREISERLTVVAQDARTSLNAILAELYTSAGE